MRTKYPDVINGTAVRPEDKEARELLIKEIEKFKKDQLNTLAGFKDHSNPSINSKQQSVSRVVQKLEDYSTMLRLDRIQEDTTSFISRFHSKNRSERKGLLEDIQEFEKRELNFLDGLKDSDSEEIQQKMQLIKKNRDQLVIQDIMGPSSAWSLQFFGPVPDGVEQEEVEQTQLAISINDLGAHYFGTTLKLGVFAEYLQERAQQFWWKDFFRAIAAFTFGCLGYKTDEQEREEYLDGLQQVFDEYKQDSSQTNSELLLTEIEKGQKQFSPRAKAGEEGYENSLHYKLELFKTDLTPIYAQESQLECTI